MADLLGLLQKYDVPGPRYTSYPTVPAWTMEVDAVAYAQALSRIEPADALSLYFHLPFCENLCHFCGCTQVITKDHAVSAAYTHHLLQELELVGRVLGPECPTVNQIHFGGGTPNFFRPDEIAQIMHQVRAGFRVTEDAEIAIEMHPRTSTYAFNQALHALGFNRISLGVQDFDGRVQRLINRDQSYEQTNAMVGELRELGFRFFNFDLVYGLPGQSDQGWEKTLDLVVGLNPARLAVYSYAHVPWVRPVQRTFKEEDLPTPMMKLQLFRMAYQRLVAAGYQLIGMDHFARSEDELALALKAGGLHRNFMGYSTRADAHQIGFGMSGISFVGGHYFQNHKKLPDYYAALTVGQLATHRGKLTNREDRLRRDLIAQLMCRGRVNVELFNQKWGIDFWRHFPKARRALQVFVEDELLNLSDYQIKVRREGCLFLRNIAMVFDAYLEAVQARSDSPVFSRTV